VKRVHEKADALVAFCTPDIIMMQPGGFCLKQGLAGFGLDFFAARVYTFSALWIIWTVLENIDFKRLYGDACT